MSEQLVKTHSEGQNKLEKQSGLDKNLVLRAQPDKSDTLFLISSLLDRIARLWQIPNWTPVNSVELAEWIYQTYECEQLEVVMRCLTSPPANTAEKRDNTWRLTPDVIAQWMAVELEREAIKLEKEHQRLKQSFKDELPKVDYDSFKKRLSEGKALQDTKGRGMRDWAKDADYQAYKAKLIANQVKHEKENSSPEGS